MNVPTTVEQINDVIPEDFSYKDHFIRFCLECGGVYFPEGAVIDLNNNRNENGFECDGLEVEFIYDVEHIKTKYDTLKKRSTEAKEFATKNFPIAKDAAGNEFFIEIPSGKIKYISWEYDIKDGLLDVCMDFKEFCLSIHPMEEYRIENYQVTRK